MAKRINRSLGVKPKAKAREPGELAQQLLGTFENPIRTTPPEPNNAADVVEPDTTYADGSRTYEEYVRNRTGRDPAPREDVRKLLDEQTGAKRTWVMPDNSPEAKAARADAKVEDAKRRIVVHNEGAPVTVSVRSDQGVRTLAVYQNMGDFRAQHDFGSYPFRESRSDKEATVILVGAKPWAGRPARPPSAEGRLATREGKSKKDLIGEMLLRPEGVTSKDVCEAMGWPSVSMPAQAKMVGLGLRKEKVEGVMRYWGIKQ